VRLINNKNCYIIIYSLSLEIKLFTLSFVIGITLSFVKRLVNNLLFIIMIILIKMILLGLFNDLQFKLNFGNKPPSVFINERILITNIFLKIEHLQRHNTLLSLPLINLLLRISNPTKIAPHPTLAIPINRS
jgi:hypothetical protein